jgi:hypothetical protein
MQESSAPVKKFHEKNNCWLFLVSQVHGNYELGFSCRERIQERYKDCLMLLRTAHPVLQPYYWGLTRLPPDPARENKKTYLRGIFYSKGRFW